MKEVLHSSSKCPFYGSEQLLPFAAAMGILTSCAAPCCPCDGYERLQSVL